MLKLNINGEKDREYRLYVHVILPFGSFGTEHTIFRLVQSVHHLDEGFNDRNVVGFAL